MFRLVSCSSVGPELIYIFKMSLFKVFSTTGKMMTVLNIS